MKKIKLIALPLILLIANPSFAKICNNAFLTEYNKFNSDNQKNCGNGNVRACFELGAEFQKLDRVKESGDLYKKACKKGLEIACLYLAAMNGKSDEQVKIYEKLKSKCKKGNQEACGDMGIGDIEVGNITLCQKNDSEVCALMGQKAYDGGNYMVAEYVANKSCAKKNVDACNLISLMKAEGIICK